MAQLKGTEIDGILDVLDDIQVSGTTLYDSSNDWIPTAILENDTITINGTDVSLGGSVTVDTFSGDYQDLTNRSHGNEDHTESYTTTDEEVENFSTQGGADTVPVSQGDGTLAMQEMEGGIEFLDDINEELQSQRKAFNSIRNRRDWIDYIFQQDETKADEITASQVLTTYVFEAENDKYDRFIDPNIALGMMAFNQENEPSLTSVYEVALFFAPTTFLEGLMTYEDLADHITSSDELMDGIMEGDKILENQFGKPANA